MGIEDQYIGSRIKQARLESGYSQADIAEAFGISGQQVQKFEKGLNRVSAKMLHKLAKILGKPMIWFTQDIESSRKNGAGDSEFLQIALEHARNIRGKKQRKQLLKIMTVFSEDA